MSYPNSHKTVFVLDHGPHFAQPCYPVEFDVQRVRGPAFIPLALISKSVWTCVVEGALEYCRIVWDIFPEDKNIRFVVAGAQPELLNGWQAEHQSCASIMTALAGVGRPAPEKHKYSGERNIIAGVETGLYSLCEPTPRQHRILAGGGGGQQQLVNRGRLVVITTVTDHAYRQTILTAAADKINQINKEVAGSDSEMLPLSHVELVLVHTTPSGLEYRLLTETDKKEVISPLLSTLFYTVTAGPAISGKLLYLCLKHYDLASTTVTGIPMKEEQNASSSANYDVELFHEAESHLRLLGDAADMILAAREGAEYQTCTLKWCTPRGNSASELHHSSGTFRITPTEVNSRQSSCLTNFLLSGRSVMLEMQRRSTGGKTISHMLTSHGGEIFIHTLSPARSILEEPPSISEGPGGRVTDYRIRDLADVMKANLLAPFPGPTEDGGPGSRAENKLSRYTKFFPLTISTTTIGNMAVVEPLYTALIKETMTDEDLAECRRVIFAIMSLEQKGETLPSPLNQQPLNTSGSGKKGAKKEEQYRAMWSELERLVTAHSDQSAKHQAVLECLMEIRQKPLVVKREVGLDVALRELDRYQAMTDREKMEFNMEDGCAAGSPAAMSLIGQQPPSKKQRLLGTGGLSLLDIYKARKEKEASAMHVEFAGRRNLGEMAQLYIKLEKEPVKTEA